MERLASYVISPAGPADAEDLGDVHVRAWRETYPGLLPQAYLNAMSAGLHARRWRRQLEQPSKGDVILAAEGAEGLVGYCAAAPLTKPPGRLADAEVFTLYLLRRAQGGGLGRRLLSAAASALAADGATSLVIWVLNDNHPARGFYDHVGGEPVSERPVSGWGGGLMETAYRWEKIRTLV